VSVALDQDARIAAAFGCKVQVVAMHHEGGRSWPEYFISDCPDGNVGAIRLLGELARADAGTSARVASVARACARVGHDAASVGARIQRFVQENVAFREDSFQFFRPSDLTLIRRSGNCVNSARVVMAAALAAGLPARVVPYAIAGEIRHTAAQVRVDGVWKWAEATLTAKFGEDPLVARGRGAVPCEFASAQQ
jgi:hypothetical protein